MRKKGGEREEHRGEGLREVSEGRRESGDKGEREEPILQVYSACMG